MSDAMTHAAASPIGAMPFGAPGEVAVDVDRVEKTFRQFSVGLRPFLRRRNVTALRGISFRVNRGEMVGILGPNGAGKTTLLKIIATLVYPTSGAVRFFGRDNRDGEIKTRGMLGLVTCDERSFYWRLSGRSNLKFFATLYGLSAAQADARIGELLAALDLTEAADRRFDGYSAGMKQKLAIARGLLKQPQIVLYDEPTRSLDPLSQHNIRHWIRQNREKHPEQTHLIATHNLMEAEQLCDRVVIVDRGRIIADGTIDEIRAFFRNDVVSHVIACVPAEPVPEEALAALPGVIRVELLEASLTGQTFRVTTDANGEGLSSALRWLTDAGAKNLSCHTETASLEDVFCSLINNEANTLLSGREA